MVRVCGVTMVHSRVAVDFGDGVIGMDDNRDGDGDGATQLGGEHDGVGGTKTQSCGGLCIQTSGGLQ